MLAKWVKNLESVYTVDQNIDKLFRSTSSKQQEPNGTSVTNETKWYAPASIQLVYKCLPVKDEAQEKSTIGHTIFSHSHCLIIKWSITEQSVDFLILVYSSVVNTVAFIIDSRRC